MAAHGMMVRNKLRAMNKSPELIAKVSISLCRYCTEFPVDNAFYDAGIDCKQANMINMSFFFLNRFLDISDAIEDPDNAAIDNTDFMDTDIPSPYDLDLPEEVCIEPKQVEEIRDWVLGWSMDQNVQQKPERNREERIQASLRKREEEVAKELSGHLHAREKEREQHRRSEAISAFQALLTDLIKHPDYSWKEAKKIFKKDSRYDKISDNLEKSERERLFDEHIDYLVAKKKENYRKLLDEQKAITLGSSFKDIKKLIKEDPRYSRYSSSERKCEKQFNEYIKDRIALAKAAFRQLLVETKFVTDKSLQLVRDKESGHLQEIEELLKKDKRYLDMEVIPDDRKSILYTYMEELEKRGPPPPPTASEPTRR